MKRKIYLASSWRNLQQPELVTALRAAGHDVYDFRNPRPGNHGFHWSDIDTNWQEWGATDFRAALGSQVALEGWALDQAAMRWADTCVLALPCGKSAHLEAGYMAGLGRRVVVYLGQYHEPELMYLTLGTSIALSVPELLVALGDCPLCGEPSEIGPHCGTCAQLLADDRGAA